MSKGLGVLQRQDELDADAFAEHLSGDPAQAAKAILSAARQGLVDAQAMLGQLLLDGRGIQRDPALAVTWFQIAARQGHAMAHNMLGRCLEHGWAGAADLPKAAEHYRHAADAGLDWGQYNLANLLATGRGVLRDPPQAFALYRRAAAQGHAKSMNLVGRFFEEGQAVMRDLPLAHDWYRRSAEAGDFRGQFSHAAVLAERGETEAALAWLQQALQCGNLNFLRVARHSLQQAPQPELQALARDYFQRAAELGDDTDRELYVALGARNAPYDFSANETTEHNATP
ncbi:MAG: tetratricopeptide repeat protein [Pseudomonas sp.]